jgi:signal transduction histidine kinase/DNA-binding response OmpR family regulator
MLLVFCLFLSSCVEEPAGPRFKIGFSQCCDDPWRHVMEKEMRREITFYPEMTLDIVSAGGSSTLQVNQIRQLVQEGLDLLIVSPNESEPLTAVIEEAYDAGIPVILIDRKTNSDKYTAYIGADNYEIGETAAHYISNKWGGRSNILEIKMQMTISPAIERNRGFMAGMRAHPSLNKVGEVEVIDLGKDGDAAIGKLLKEHPEADVVFAHTDLLAETAYRVAQREGISTPLAFIGIDGIPGTGNGIQAVEDGVLTASLLYPTGGSEAIKLAIAVLNRLPFDRKNILQSTVIDRGNARIIHAQMKKEASLQESIDKQSKGLSELKNIYRSQKTYIFILVSSLLISILLGAFFLKSLRMKQAVNRRLEQKNREVLENEQQIMAMSDELRFATQAKVDFFTNISHEFRTPLTLILGFTEDLFPNAKQDAETRQSLKLIQQNAQRLLRLVNQILDFRKIESDGMKLKASENNLVAFVRGAMESYSKKAQQRQIDFKLITRQEELYVWFDQSMLDKVLFNLLSNAFKFTPNGGSIQVSISVDQFENKVKVRVEDSGTGMSSEVTEHIFEAFYQAPDGQTLGSGLGLSLSKALVELHKGEITVSSILGKGSRFVVTLPLGSQHLSTVQMVNEIEDYTYLALPQIFEQEEMEEDNLLMNGPGVPDQQVLIIEDNEEMRFFLKKKLRSQYQVVVAKDGEIGVELALKAIPDFILCDVLLPGMSGLEVVRALKSDLRTSHIPIILLTARGAEEQQLEGLRTGADDYMIKPFNVKLLMEKIRSLLNNRHLLRDSFGSKLIYQEEGQHSKSLERIELTLDEQFMVRFKEYVDQHFSRHDFQVNDLCKDLKLSRSQLYRKVKALLGQNISDYIQDIRLEHACKLLIEGTKSVSEIAYAVGYSSPDYFSTVFKSKYNIAPSQFSKSI